MPNKDPEIERANARARYYRLKAADPDRVRRQSVRSNQAWARRNPEKARALNRDHVRKWRMKNPEKARARARRRRERKRAVEQSDAMWTAVLEADPCSYCGGRGGTVDHIVPLASGGDGSDRNLAGACSSCNSRKWTYSLLEFLMR